MGHETGPVLAPVHYLRWGGRHHHALAAGACQRLLHVHLLLEASRNVLVHFRGASPPQRLELVAAARGTNALCLGHQVLYLASGRLGPARRTLPSLLQGLLPASLGVRAGLLTPQQLLDRWQPLATPAEDALSRAATFP